MSEKMPPPGLSTEELTDWWNGTLKKEGLGGWIETQSDYERESLKNARRLPNSNRFNPGRY